MNLRPGDIVRRASEYEQGFTGLHSNLPPQGFDTEVGMLSGNEQAMVIAVVRGPVSPHNRGDILCVCLITEHCIGWCWSDLLKRVK